MKAKAIIKIFCVFLLLGNFWAVASSTTDKPEASTLSGAMQTFEGRLVKKSLFLKLFGNNDFALVDSKNKIIIHVKIIDKYLKNQAEVLLNKKVVLVGKVEVVDKEPFQILRVSQIILRTSEH